MKLIQITTLTMYIFLNSPNLFADLRYDGSSTIGEGIMPEAVKLFKEKHGIAFSHIGLQGSGKGYEALMAGKVDIAGMSRALTANEKSNMNYYSIIGYDAIVIYVHKNNPVNSLSRQKIKDIFSGKITNWNEVGGKNEPIRVVTELLKGKRATIEEFKRDAMDGAEYGRSKEIDKPHDCVRYVSSDEKSITFASLTFSQEPNVKYILYENISPTKENIRSGAYTLSRLLILVVRSYPTGDIKNFINFILTDEGQKIVSKNFIPVKNIKDK